MYKRVGLFLAALTCVTVICAALTCASPVAARPIVPAEKRIIPWHADLPSCDNPAVLERLSSRFAAKETEYWHSDLQIVSYDRIGAYAYRANGRDYIPRRYCGARALLSNGKRHWTVYTIGEELGIIGFAFGLADYKFGLDWCVEGLDRGWAYGPNCAALRPVAQPLTPQDAAVYKWRAPPRAPSSTLKISIPKPLPAPILPALPPTPVPAPAAPLPPLPTP